MAFYTFRETLGILSECKTINELETFAKLIEDNKREYPLSDLYKINTLLKGQRWFLSKSK